MPPISEKASFFGRFPGSALCRFLKGSFEDGGKDEHEDENY